MVTNHSFRFSHLEILLNVQKGKSYMQVDPIFYSLHTTERPFSRHTIYIYACKLEGRPKEVCAVETLKQH